MFPENVPSVDDEFRTSSRDLRNFRARPKGDELLR